MSEDPYRTPAVIVTLEEKRRLWQSELEYHLIRGQSPNDTTEQLEAERKRIAWLRIQLWGTKS